MDEATDEIAPTQIQTEFETHSCAETLIEDFRSRMKDAS
jgi:hypothetical protein